MVYYTIMSWAHRVQSITFFTITLETFHSAELKRDKGPREMSVI